MLNPKITTKIKIYVGNISKCNELWAAIVKKRNELPESFIMLSCNLIGKDSCYSLWLTVYDKKLFWNHYKTSL